MKKYCYIHILIFTLCIQYTVVGQTVLQKNTPEGGDLENVASEEVRLTPPIYQYAPTNQTEQMHAYIDKTLNTEPAVYGPMPNNNDFDNHQIDENLMVGQTPGEASVSSTGAATYTIPIQLPKGTNGMEPQLSVNYNSQSGNGIAGYGWSISGLSMIMRGGKNIYANGKTEGIRMNNTDNLYLDGNRLIEVSPGEYRTENETFSRIIPHGTIGNGPDWFEVQTKDGMTMEYGKDGFDARRFGTDNNSEVSIVFWRLNKVYDNNGNYIEYHYKDDGQESRIDKILYTGNHDTGMSPYNAIYFHYKERQDKNVRYLENTQTGMMSKYLLDKIEITTVDYHHFRSYEFTYGYDLYSFLTQIQEVGANDKKLNPIVFKYGEKGSNVNQQSTLPNSGADLFITGDFNGDGFTDIVLSNFTFQLHNQTDGRIFDHNNYRLHLNNNGDFNTTPDYQFNVNNEISSIVFYTDSYNKNFNTGLVNKYLNSDFNGDGLDDFISISRPSPTSNGINSINIYYSNGSSFSKESAVPPLNYEYADNENNFLFTGDFDGNGATDYMTFTESNIGNTKKTHMSFPSLNLFNLEVIPPSSLGNFDFSEIATANMVYTVDFKGDGKTNLMVTNDNLTRVFSFEINQQLNIVEVTLIYSSGFPTKYHLLIPGDFNGDGKTDFLETVDENNWNIAYSTGNSFVSTSFDMPQYFNPNYEQNSIGIADLNGDGLSDILINYRDTIINGGQIFSLSKRRVFYSNGIGFENGSLQQGSPEKITKNNLSGNFDGDGSQDFIYRDSNYDFYFTNINEKGNELNLKETKDAFNNKQKFNYNYITNVDYYMKGNNADFPLNDFQKGLSVVTSVEQPNGIGGTSETQFKYKEALLHRQGRGFLGFKEIESKNLVSHIKSTNIKSLDEDHYFLYPQSSETYLSLDNNPNNDELLSENQYDMDLIDLNNGRYWLKNNEIYNIDYFSTTINTTSYFYDNYGNITQTIENFYDIFGASGDPADNTGNKLESVVTEISYAQHGSWIPSSPISQTSTTTREGESPYTRSSTMSYNTEGNVTSVVTDPGDSKSTTKNFLYDDFGNVIQTTIAAAGVQNRVTKQQMDAQGRFPITTTNQLGQNTQITYNYQWGKPKSITGVDGLVTQYEYDEFGRMINEIDPKGVVSEVFFDWDIGTGSGSGTTTVNNSIYTVTTTSDGKPEEKMWMDAFSRERKIEIEGFDQVITTVTSYDERGNTKTTAGPFSPTSTVQPVITTNHYDDYNRLIESENDAGSTTYSYSNNLGITTTTVTSPDGKVSTNKREVVTGSPVLSSDDGGTTEFKYYSSGQQKEILLNGNTVAQMQYDLQNNQTQLNDANAGISNYDYNAFGELISQTDGNNVLHEMSYDQLGRLTEKIGPDGTTSYEYITSGNGLNGLKEITDPNGHKVTYTYDQFSRMINVDEFIEGELFTKSYTYNNNNQVTSITHPSGFTIQKHYDNNGYLTSISDISGQNNYFTLVATNAFGNYTEYTLGNGITTEKVYDQYGLPVYIGDGNIQSILMDFNQQNGNLNFRDNLIYGNQELFEYDDMDRLVKSEVNPPSQNPGNPVNEIVLDYTDNGNITYKSGVGDYLYSNARPNALETIENIEDMGLPEDQFIQYTSFNKIKKINEGLLQQTFTYGFDEQRRKSYLYDDNTLEKTITHVGDYEKIEIGNGTYEVHYIGCGDGLVAMNVRTNGGADEIYYTYTDHLGSILTVTDENANMVHDQSFDAWGKRRNPVDWTYDNIDPAPPWLIRGYTYHEHMDEFDLINMNGRVYDPVVSRMLSPDNFVQEPGYSQSYNRYSYVWNNPLNRIDPTGDLHFLIPVVGLAVAGGYIGGSIQQGKGGLSGANWNPFGGPQGRWDHTWWQGATVGAFVGAGVGLSLTVGLAGLATLPNVTIPKALTITGISKGTSFFALNGSTTMAWSVASNGIITANINMASRHLQGGSWEQVAVSGLIGFGAGATGGFFGGKHTFLNAMTEKGIKTQNYWTNILNGSADRFYRSVDAGYSERDIAKNTILGGVEGLIAARMLSTDKMINFGSGLNRFGNPVFGRYSTSFLSNSLTSNPGASFMAARIYGAVYPTWMLGKMNNTLLTSIMVTLTGSPFIYLGLGGLQSGFVNPNYPYAYEFLRP